MDKREVFAKILSEIFHKVASNDQAIDVISLATSDGFAVQDYQQNCSDFEPDTMAAAASTLYSVSNAVAQQILGKKYKSTFIEATEGNVCFVAFEYDTKDYVLAMSADDTMNIAQLRICINGLVEDIKNIVIS